MKRKRFVFAFLLISLVFIMPSIAYAYIDPATTTYLIQIFSALFITLGVTMGIFFNRIYMFFVNIRVKMTAFFVKLFSKKQESVRTVRKHQAPTQIVETMQVSKGKFLWQDNRSFKQRLLIAVLLSAAVAFTFIIFGIYDLYAGNASIFPFVFNDIAWPVVLTGLICMGVICAVLIIFKGQIFDILTSFLLGLLIAGYLQGNFMNLQLGQLTGDAIPWQDYAGYAIVNTVVWILIIAIPFIIHYFSKKAWNATVKIVPGILIVIQLISLLSIVSAPAASPKQSELYLSTEGIYDVAQDNNIILIVLDRLDEQLIEEVAADNPNYFDALDGFTRFTNNMSYYSRTFPAVPNIMSGKIYLFDQEPEEYFKDAWQNSEFLPELKQNGFDSRLYMSQGYCYQEAEDIVGVADNIAMGTPTVKTLPALKSFLRLSAYRYAPHVMKPSFWVSTERFGQLLDIQQEPAPYVMDDIAFYNALKDQKLSINEKGERFTYIHLNGSHAPFNMNENAEPVSESQSSYLQQTKGSFHIVYEYLNQLKALGKYKDATIIITGDHGISDDLNPLAEAKATGLFVKPAGSEGTPLQISNAPVNTDNLRATVIAAAGLDSAKYGPTYFEVNENANIERKFYNRINPQEDQPGYLEEYTVNGDAKDFANWHKVGNIDIGYWYG